MNTSSHIILLLFSSMISCQFQTKKDSANLSEEQTTFKSSSTDDRISNVYHNEYGEIKLFQINDTTWQTTFENNDGVLFDTVMVVDTLFGFYHLQDEIIFLKYNVGGLSVSTNQIIVLEYSNYGRLAHETQIPKMYERPFFSTENSTIEGDIIWSKGGPTVNGIYLVDMEEAMQDYMIVEGIVQKQKYPIEYYSTSESPQGMFDDTTEVHYQLILENYKLDRPENSTYKGSAVNDSEGNACIAWEFADSEAYILEGHEGWNKNDIGKEIQVEGFLVQNQNGSFLKNWKIITE